MAQQQNQQILARGLRAPVTKDMVIRRYRDNAGNEHIINLLGIDLQKCFIRIELVVPGADKDVENVAYVLDEAGHVFNAVYATKDMHEKKQPFHRYNWRWADGSVPTFDPSDKRVINGILIPVTGEMVRDGIIVPDPTLYSTTVAHFESFVPLFLGEDLKGLVRDVTIEHVRAQHNKGVKGFSHGVWHELYPWLLERPELRVDQMKTNAKGHVIWIDHALDDSEGQHLDPVFRDALDRWMAKYPGAQLVVIPKGKGDSERYSFVFPEVIIPGLASSNAPLQYVQALKDSDYVVIVGEALTHCDLESVEDIIRVFGAASRKIILLEDCMSPVPGFEQLGVEWLEHVQRDHNVIVTNSRDFVECVKTRQPLESLRSL